ncbi:hypothetical protein CHLRE_06g253051v5 [Chlamydomonas reinhardtii]|uniref:Uncharacterized protein n=1 Tax=Chlamydomonas reinhardtii TaxID=3055 RepID=A8HYE7_CHLRE|nr:uncharacterized protein CHLRE_06g253051v5 [Chlamydomonas reinhardtii]PNW81595.1 hypothetical protein CHLRE_06g253051v5 [Chlamydomonas reinhardtii]|eukprot:XP_001696638.1 predicted protein [Chlamydomonas reinhardtii]
MDPGKPWNSLSLRRKPAVLAIRISRELQRRPLLAECVPTAIGFAFGDCLTQFMNRDRKRTLREQWSFSRTGTMLCVGALCAGPVLLSFGRWMDLSILPTAPTSPLALSVKVVGCFIWQVAYITIKPAYRRSAVALLESSSVMIETQTQRLGLRHAHHAVAS